MENVEAGADGDGGWISQNMLPPKYIDVKNYFEVTDGEGDRARLAERREILMARSMVHGRAIFEAIMPGNHGAWYGGKLGAYEIVGPLSAGGMGEVYRARGRDRIASNIAGEGYWKQTINASDVS